jgi:hypothetical protein
VVFSSVLVSAITATAFYFTELSGYDSGEFLSVFLAPFAVLSFPGALVGTIISGGLRGSAHAGGMLWEVVVIAFIFNAGLYCGVIGTIVALMSHVRSRKQQAQ